MMIQMCVCITHKKAIDYYLHSKEDISFAIVTLVIMFSTLYSGGDISLDQVL